MRNVDQSGRMLGPRAEQTRRRLLDATAGLLAATPLRDLKVIDVARAVGSSPATFYQYFEGVEDAVLALAARATAEMPAIVEQIEGPWSGSEGRARARVIVEAFIEHWDRHHAVLRVRNLASDEGDARFMEVRRAAMSPVIEALAAQIGGSRRAGRVRDEIHPYAAAAAMASILERLAAYHHELGAFGVTREQLVETSAAILLRTVTGRGQAQPR